MHRLPAAVTMANASASLAELCRAIDAGETEIDLASLAHSDSSAVAVLLAAVRHARGSGRTLRLTGAPTSLQALTTLYGVESLVALSADAPVATARAA